MFAFGTFAQVTEAVKSLTSALFMRLLKSTVKVVLSERVNVAVPVLESKVPDVSLAKFVSSRYRLISRSTISARWRMSPTAFLPTAAKLLAPFRPLVFPTWKTW